MYSIIFEYANRAALNRKEQGCRGLQRDILEPGGQQETQWGNQHGRSDKDDPTRDIILTPHDMGRFVEIHDLDDFKIVERADHASRNADSSKYDHVRLHRRLKDDEFAPETEQRRYTGKRQHHDRER